MGKEIARNIKLGAFVLAGTIFLVVVLYMMGEKRRLFGSTFSIQAQFNNVNGLMAGNNVRFAGINVGTVESVEIISDSMVEVIMLIEEGAQKFIKKNAIASIGTDGLMGNKLVNINSGAIDNSQSVEENDNLISQSPIETDEMLRTLNTTNDNIKVITGDLKKITQKINSRNTLWSLLLDTVIAENAKAAVVNLKLMSNTGVLITGDLKRLTDNMNRGKGSLGALITDTVLSSRLSQTVVNFQKLSDTVGVLSGDISGIISDLKQGKGSIGLLMKDTMLVHNLNSSILTIEKGAGNFNENMDALKSSWPFKRYFKKLKSKK